MEPVFGLNLQVWSALSTIGTLLAASASIAAAYFTSVAARAAAASAKAAAESNELARSHAETQRLRRARSIAGPIRREIADLEKTLTAFWLLKGSDNPQLLFTMGSVLQGNLPCELLERFADRFDDFDEPASHQLGSLLASIRRARGAFSMEGQDTSTMPFEVLRSLNDKIEEKLEDVVRRAKLARTSLLDYDKSDQELDLSEPHMMESLEHQSRKLQHAYKPPAQDQSRT